MRIGRNTGEATKAVQQAMDTARKLGDVGGATVLPLGSTPGWWPYSASTKKPAPPLNSTRSSSFAWMCKTEIGRDGVAVVDHVAAGILDEGLRQPFIDFVDQALLAGALLHEGLEAADEFLLVFGRQVAVDQVPVVLLVFKFFDDGFEGFMIFAFAFLDAEDDVAVHLDEAAVAVPREAFIFGGGGE